MNTLRLLRLTPLLIASAGFAQQPATKPAKPPARKAKPVTVELAFIASPKPEAVGHSDNADIERLITQHNAAMTRVAHATLVGKCVWTFTGQTAGRAMKLDFDRTSGHAAVACGSDACEADGAKVTYPSDTAMLIDAQYLVALRTYDPKAFTSAAKSVIERRNPATEEDFTSVTVLKSPAETLSFDATTGRLLRAVVDTPRGKLTADFDDFVPVPTDGTDKVTLPATIALVPPKSVFPFTGVPDNPEIRFLVNVEQSRVSSAAAGARPAP